MIDAIVAVRKPYDEKARDAATAKAKETLGSKEAYQKASAADQEKMLGAEVKANLLTAWRATVDKTPALKELENLQRAAQWRLDYVAAENSMGFHAPQELGRILGESIDLARQAQVKATLLGGGATTTASVVVPASQGAKK